MTWSDNFRREDSVMILIGTKKDKEAEREVDPEEALEFAKSRGISYFEVSSYLNKEDGGLKELF